MKFTSLDAITRSVLLQKHLPIHYYLQYAKLAADWFRELHFSTLRVVNARLLPVNNHGAVDLPCDFVDYVKVGLPVGQKVRLLVQDDSISRLKALDAQGNPTRYGLPPASAGDQIGGAALHFNDHGEYIGRHFALHSGMLSDTFKLLPERGQIQLNEAITAREIVLEYISDGTYCNAATKVDPLAQACIEAYMFWKSSPNALNQYSPEGRLFLSKWRELKARKNPLTVEDIKRIFNASRKATIK